MLDDEQLEDLIPAESPDGTALLSRRRFLTGAATGGAVGLALGAGVGVAAGMVSRAQAEAALASRDTEITRLQGLLKLYEGLEDVGLDSILDGGLAALALPLGAVELGARALLAGLERVEEALISLRGYLPDAHDALGWLDAQVQAASDSLQKLASALDKALDKAAGSAVVSAVREFVSVVLDRLPFGFGDKIRGVFDGLVQLVTGAEELVRDVNPRAFEPLQKLAGSSSDTGISSSLIDPLVEHVLDPLQDHLDDLAALAETWQNRLANPARLALDERNRIREEIAQYRHQNGLA